MTGIYLTKYGTPYISSFREGEFHYYEFQDDSEILSYLGESVELEEGFTLRSYFYLLIMHSSLQLLDMFSTDYVEEFTKCPSKGCLFDDDEISYLSLSRIVNYENLGFRENEEDDWRIEDCIDFSGVGEESAYAIEFSPLDKLLDYEIKIDPAVISIEQPGDLTDYEDLTEKYQDFRGKDNNFTLFEFVKSIIWELSFCGTPEDRENKVGEIQNSLDKAMKELGEKGE